MNELLQQIIEQVFAKNRPNASQEAASWVKLLSSIPSRVAGDYIPPPESQKEIPLLDPIVASEEMVKMFGFDPQNLQSEWKETIDSPFVQDTVRRIVNELPTYGMAKAPYPLAGNPSNANAFVTPVNPTRAFLNPRTPQDDPMEPYNIALHEAVHTRELQEDPEFKSLMNELRPDFEKLETMIIEGKADNSHIVRLAGENAGEHLAYAVQIATDIMRYSKTDEKTLQSDLEYWESVVPGVKKAFQFVQKKLAKH